MGLFEVLAAIIGAIIVLIISLVYRLSKPYSEPIVTEGKIVDKYEITASANELSLIDYGGYYNMPHTFLIRVLMENGDKTSFRISQEKYDVFEIDDSVKVIEYSQLKRVVEKNLDARGVERI